MEDSVSGRKIERWGEGPSVNGQRESGRHGLKPLELMNFRGKDFCGQVSKVLGEIYGLNIFLFLGQEMIAHRWNLQWEPEWSGPTQAAQQKAPFTGSIQI